MSTAGKRHLFSSEEPRAECSWGLEKKIHDFLLGSMIERMASKSSRKSGMSVSGMDDTVKFKLVEDLNLVTIPITTCLTVLLG